MKTLLRTTMLAAATLLAAQANADVIFYEHEHFGGRTFTTQQPLDNFRNFGFNDRASSVVVTGRDDWEVCEDVGFRGRCTVLRPGSYPSLRAMDLNDRLSSARALERGHRHHGRYAPHPMPGKVVFYERSDFRGRAFTAEEDVVDFQNFGFNDRASSVVVLGQPVEVCEHADFRGECMVLRPGRYASLRDMGLNNQISSVRQVRHGGRFDDRRYAPQPVPAYDWRRRPEERLYTVNIDYARAVYAAPQQRCWVEQRQQAVQQPQRGEPNVGGAVVGGILGGILGHQVGGGTGKDLATIGGAVAGAAIGAQVGRDAPVTSTQNVQRCANVPAQGRPDYWDVAYHFRGVEHHMQTSTPPGPTVTVNDNGEPRTAN